MKKLAICIPTYNRGNTAVKQIEFIINEAKNCSFSEQLEIIVSDNASSEEHLNIVEYFLGEYKWIRLIKNETNKGLVGNLKVLERSVSSEYVWFIGDDDKLYSGILKYVFGELSGEGLVFINHQAVNSSGDILLRHACTGQEDNMYEVLASSGTTMMFITACIYRRDLLHDSFANQDERLSLPLYSSFYCAEKGGVKFINEILIDNMWGDISWAEQKTSVFAVQVPMDLLRSLSFSNNKIKASMYITYYLLKNVKHFIAHILFKLGVLNFSHSFMKK